jgi:hypothetical protein
MHTSDDLVGYYCIYVALYSLSPDDDNNNK